MRVSLPLIAIAAAFCMVVNLGCKPEAAGPSAATNSTAPSSNDDHGHPHEGEDDHAHAGGHGAGPHEGTLADWGGGKYHVEFTVDHEKQEGTDYILGADEKTPTPIRAAEIQLSITDPMMQVTLKASPQEGDAEGTASRFVGNHEKLGVVQEYAGTISGVIDDTPYSGDFAEVAHAH